VVPAITIQFKSHYCHAQYKDAPCSVGSDAHGFTVV